MANGGNAKQRNGGREEEGGEPTWTGEEKKKVFGVYMTSLSGGRTTEITHVFSTTASRYDCPGGSFN